MRSNQHSRRQVLLFLLFAIIAFIVWFQDRWGVPLFLYRQVPEKPISVSPLVAPAPPREEALQVAVITPARQVVEGFHFKNESSLSLWEQKVFKGKTDYSMHAENDVIYLRSESRNASSGLFIKTKHKATPELRLSWKWRALKFPKKKNPEKLSNRSEDDFSARVYVIFAASNIFKSDVIEYVWDENLPLGAHAESPYSDRIHLLVVKNGVPVSSSESWDLQDRNVYADYRMLFGKDPKYDIGMIAVMSDSDNTGTEAAADFADLALTKE